MGRAKNIIVQPIQASDARRLVRQWHYSGKVVNNSQVHLGCFLDGKCGGVMQFGPSLDKRKLVGLVHGTLWNEFIELNRMAFADWLPRNSESRCIAVAMRLLRANYPQLKWVVSFADASLCGDGTIYRASGFVLTAIKQNASSFVMPDGEVFSSFTAGAHRTTEQSGKAGKRFIEERGGILAEGFQLRYVYFLHPEERANLTVPELPFSRIAELGAGMYKGQKRTPSTGTAPQEQQAVGTRPVRSSEPTGQPEQIAQQGS